MTRTVLKPLAIRPGARIAVIAPASSAKAERIDGGIAALQGLGFEVVEGKHLRGSSPQYFSGTAEQRLDDLQWAFREPGIDAIICSRGGYGSNYLLEDLDLDLVRSNPKPFFAYSDMTVLQTWLLDRLGLVSFHGPMTAADFYCDGGFHAASFDAALSGRLAAFGEAEGLRILKPGRATGILYGGCLSMLVSTLGTLFAAELEEKLLFLEDVNVRPYEIDRMLRQLMIAGKLDGVKGIVFGEMLNCGAPGAEAEMLHAVILRVLDWFDGPVATGLRSGHVSRENVTLTFGIEAELVLEEKPLLRLLEPAVRI